MKKDIRDRHTFVICAYKESPYLEECILSLKSQTVTSCLLMATSTPNDKIRSLAEKYEIPLSVNTGEAGIAGDWNFALSLAKTPLVTLAHQDDIYEERYAEEIAKRYEQAKDPVILFTGYAERRGKERVTDNRLLRVKKILLSPLKIRAFENSRFIRRRILSFGSAICCPAVTMVREKLPVPLFENNMKSNIDWQAWELLSKKEGAFCYLPEPLMQHRIHEGSTTSELLGENARRQEDIFMFRKFWPGFIADLIEVFYQKGESSNQLKQ